MITEDFFERLATREESSRVANPYSRPELLNNLRIYFDWMESHAKGKRVLMVGEAPGHSGCLLTGVPFTSGKVFQKFCHPLLNDLKDKLSFPEMKGEPTATMVWDGLSRYKTIPLLWNAFPFHPHDEGNPNSNRTPHGKERSEGESYLADIERWYRPDVIVSVGKEGYPNLCSTFPNHDVKLVRHPSNGGKDNYLSGISNIL